MARGWGLTAWLRGGGGTVWVRGWRVMGKKILNSIDEKNFFYLDKPF